MKRIKPRIARIEHLLPPPREPSVFDELIPYWTSGEMQRLLAFRERNMAMPNAELERLALRAVNRQRAGMAPGRMNESAEGMAQKEAAFEFWRFKRKEISKRSDQFSM